MSSHQTLPHSCNNQLWGSIKLSETSFGRVVHDRAETSFFVGKPTKNQLKEWSSLVSWPCIVLGAVCEIQAILWSWAYSVIDLWCGQSSMRYLSGCIKNCQKNWKFWIRSKLSKLQNFYLDIRHMHFALHNYTTVQVNWTPAYVM